MKHHPSPNHNARPENAVIDFLILHYTGMKTGEEARVRLCDPASQVSAHYMIEEDGRCTPLVSEDRRAWHAGVSYWAGETDINARSIGIELVNPGHEFGYRSFSKAQMERLAALSQLLVKKYPIHPRQVLGHSDIAPCRKQDPGELFDWKWLAAQGIGVWPEEGTEEIGALSVLQIQNLLQQYGYHCPTSGTMDIKTGQVIAAFQRHFYPEHVSGTADQETVRRLLTLAKQADNT